MCCRVFILDRDSGRLVVIRGSAWISPGAAGLCLGMRNSWRALGRRRGGREWPLIMILAFICVACSFVRFDLLTRLLFFSFWLKCSFCLTGRIIFGYHLAVLFDWEKEENHLLLLIFGFIFYLVSYYIYFVFSLYIVVFRFDCNPDYVNFWIVRLISSNWKILRRLLDKMIKFEQIWSSAKKVFEVKAFHKRRFFSTVKRMIYPDFDFDKMIGIY